MVELVFAPAVHLIAKTVIDPAGLNGWINAHGYGDLVDYNDSESDIRDDTALGRFVVGYPENNGVDWLPEFAGRFCYRAWDKGREHDEYISNVIAEHHGSVLEHSVVSLSITGVSRSLVNELIRQRAGTAISQESQRYVDAKDVRFVVPPLLAASADATFVSFFETDCAEALAAYITWQERYRQMIADLDAKGDIKLATMAKKRANEAARSMLPNASETRAVWTMNTRAARHVIELRGSEHADLEIRRLAVAMLGIFRDQAPAVFADFETYTADDGFTAVRCQHSKV